MAQHKLFFFIFVNWHPFFRKTIEWLHVAISMVLKSFSLLFDWLPLKVREFSLPYYINHCCEGKRRIHIFLKSISSESERKRLTQNLNPIRRYHFQRYRCRWTKVNEKIKKIMNLIRRSLAIWIFKTFPSVLRFLFNGFAIILPDYTLERHELYFYTRFATFRNFFRRQFEIEKKKIACVNRIYSDIIKSLSTMRIDVPSIIIGSAHHSSSQFNRRMYLFVLNLCLLDQRNFFPKSKIFQNFIFH